MWAMCNVFPYYFPIGVFYSNVPVSASLQTWNRGLWREYHSKMREVSMHKFLPVACCHPLLMQHKPVTHRQKRLAKSNVRLQCLERYDQICGKDYLLLITISFMQRSTSRVGQISITVIAVCELSQLVQEFCASTYESIF